MINNDFYDELHEKWYSADNHPVALLRAENATRIPWIIEQISKSHCKVLDIGCGGGFLANALAKEGHDVTGIDLSEESLSIARLKDETKSVQYQFADGYALPFEEKKFDVVCAMDFLEHVEDPAEIIREAARVLKPGGQFFFHTFNRNWFSYLLAIKGVEFFIRNTPKNMHIYRLFIKPEELKKMCERSQLTVKMTHGLMPKMDRSFWKILVTRKVSKKFSFQFTSSLRCGYVGYAVNSSSKGL